MSKNTHTDVLLAGAFAAFTVDLLVYPLDTIKTRFQSPDYQKIYYDGTKNTLNKKLLFRGLYQGVGSVILVTLPSSGAFFTTYEGVKSQLLKANPTQDGVPLIPLPFIHSAASAAAELVSCVILTPAEVLKQNAQMIRRPEQASGSKSSKMFQSSVTIQAFKQFKHPSQLFRGYGSLVARNLPYTAMQFPMFEHMKESIKQYRKQNGTATGTLLETGLVTGLSAGTAGSIAAVITTPVDVVKTRIMLSAAGESSPEKAQEQVEKAQKQGQSLDKLAKEKGVTKKSSLTVARDIIAESGAKGLFRGVILRSVWTFLGAGIFMGTYESGRVWLGDRRGTEGSESNDV